jgi:hypothetical protein
LGLGLGLFAKSVGAMRRPIRERIFLPLVSSPAEVWTVWRWRSAMGSSYSGHGQGRTRSEFLGPCVVAKKRKRKRLILREVQVGR